MAQDRISVVVVDDHPMLREGVIHTLQQEHDIEVLGEGQSAAEALELAKEFLPDIILLDVNMPGSGIEAAASIAKECPVVKTVMLTVSEDETTITDAFAAGACGYILKGVSGPEFINALHSINAGSGYVPPDLAARLLADARKPHEEGDDELLNLLTRREEEILQLVCDGLSNREIGDALHLREKSVKTYMTNILQKLKVRNRVKAALMIQRQAIMKELSG